MIWLSRTGIEIDDYNHWLAMETTLKSYWNKSASRYNIKPLTGNNTITQ